MTWFHDGVELKEEALVGYKAFVYCISNLIDGKQYFGKKRLHFTTHKRKKGRKNRIRLVRESDWRDYYGSNDDLKRDVEKYGAISFRRDILRLCKSLSESSYWELYYQMSEHVLLHPKKYYNQYVGGRISRKQLGVK